MPLLVSMSFLYSTNYVNDGQFKFVVNWINFVKNTYFDFNRKSNLDSSTDEKVFTSDELKKYRNLNDGLYISILGQVFDVTKGEKFYGPGATYHVFTGCDASLAFITGEFHSKGLTDDISSLSIEQVKMLDSWVQFYNKNYIYKGKLSGRYYDEHGSPTDEFHNVQRILMRAKEEQFVEEHKKKMFPPCNVEWKQDSGSVVWCTKKSGGIERDWIGVPRMLFESPNSKEYRCACIKLDSREYHDMKGMIREYLHCPKTSVKCAVKEIL